MVRVHYYEPHDVTLTGHFWTLNYLWRWRGREGGEGRRGGVDPPQGFAEMTPLEKSSNC